MSKHGYHCDLIVLLSCGDEQSVNVFTQHQNYKTIFHLKQQGQIPGDKSPCHHLYQLVHIALA